MQQRGYWWWNVRPQIKVCGHEEEKHKDTSEEERIGCPSPLFLSTSTSFFLITNKKKFKKKTVAPTVSQS